MKFFFEPRGVAVIGATPKPNTGGLSLITNLTLGYDGPIYPVNPRYSEIVGLPCYPRISEVPDPIELALIFVPAPGVPSVLEECLARGLKGAIIESGGFAEVGPEGKALQDRCLEIARRGGMRLWGPNCMGLIDIRKRYVFSFLTPDAWQDVLNPGGVSLIVQSGLLAGGFMTTLMSHKTLALAKACSIGNKSDVDETDLLEYFLEDADTRVIALYVESFPRGRRFFDLASQGKKPIVVLKGGKSASGARAAASHTASLAGNFELVRGALDQAGVYQADDFFELVDLARTLEMDFVRDRPDEGKTPGGCLYLQRGRRDRDQRSPGGRGPDAGHPFSGNPAAVGTIFSLLDAGEQSGGFLAGHGKTWSGDHLPGRAGRPGERSRGGRDHRSSFCRVRGLVPGYGKNSVRPPTTLQAHPFLGHGP